MDQYFEKLIYFSCGYADFPVNHAYIRSATANAVNSNTQHMQGQLTNAQGNSVVPQGSLQQPAQQPQPMPAMTMPIAPTGEYSLKI